MATKLIIGGRVLGTGRYGGDPKCLCGDSVVILGRCEPCHVALRRRRLGLPASDEVEKKRLKGYLEKFKVLQNGRCEKCGAVQTAPHDPRCLYFEEEKE